MVKNKLQPSVNPFFIAADPPLSRYEKKNQNKFSLTAGESAQEKSPQTQLENLQIIAKHRRVFLAVITLISILCVSGPQLHPRSGFGFFSFFLFNKAWWALAWRKLSLIYNQAWKRLFSFVIMCFKDTTKLENWDNGLKESL